jgi:glyoxylase-like metal-dependent hydrolase (beta-lactamase superfamily II)
MRLTGEVALVGGGALGLGLTHEADSHVYLIDGGDALALVDVGTGLATDRLLSMVRADGYDPARIRLAFITHPHADHAGGAHSIREGTGAAIAAAPEAAAFLRNADEHGFNLDSARAAGRYPADYRLTACDVEHELSDGQEVPVGRLQVRAIRTPGHSAGGLCFWVRGEERTYLFTGDTLFFGGKVLTLATEDCSVPALRDSIARLVQLQVDALLPGHLMFCLSGGHAHIQTAHAVFSGLGVPPNIL